MATGGLIRGTVGRIMWSYYAAASVTDVIVTRSVPHVGQCACAKCAQGRWSLHAVLVLSDAFKLSRKPLMFVIQTNKGDMIWPITDLEIKDRSVTAALGTPLADGSVVRGV